MEKAFDRVGNLIQANKAYKNIGGYTCPCCGEDVIKAEGRIQIAHFRHKVGGKKEWCDLYTQGLGDFYDPLDYATSVRRPYITFEETESEWEFYLKFPKISRNYTRLFEDKGLYFNVRCIEIQQKLSSINLRHDSITNKMKINPKELYHISLDNRDYASKLNLKWPEIINGFQRDNYIFAYINGDYVMMERKEISLHETFYFVSKKKFSSFHKSLTVQPLKCKNGWYAYKINLPNTLDDNLVKWFFNNLNYQIKPPYYYLDLVSPSLYERHDDYSYAVYKPECTIALTFCDFKQSSTTIVHLDSDMSSQEYEITSYIKEFPNLSKGFHTFYIKGHEGKMLNLYIDNTRANNKEIHYKNRFLTNGQEAFVFKDKEVNRKNTVDLIHDIPFELWCKEKGLFPFPLKETNYVISTSNTIIYTPSVWSLRVHERNENQQLKINVLQLLQSYLRLEYGPNIFITTKQYKALLNIIEKLPDGIEKRKINYFIKLYRNRAPRMVEEILKNTY
ncbi:hypothetical protein KW850_25735 [Bacillus sp. sid0103]|uniref:hypothetical protein n=1 Tax=Bacillus sp. sid0103 TaxID=2856337 RepID=UPI001C494B16|nr:hypothetical protein [Bacillus sp. sid0103]MBV7508622.1 hypothetical protein [Bacillus sp. sid0103]